MVDWKRLERMVDRTIVAAYGEALRHSPMKNGVADTSRPQREIDGILHSPNADGTVSFGNGMISTIATTESALVIQRADYPDIIIRAGDRFRATNDAGAAVLHAVSKVSDRFPSIIVVHLAPV